MVAAVVLGELEGPAVKVSDNTVFDTISSPTDGLAEECCVTVLLCCGEGLDDVMSGNSELLDYCSLRKESEAVVISIGCHNSTVMQRDGAAPRAILC